MNDLNSILSGIEILLYRDEDGDQTVVSNTEPAFCFVRKSEAELRALVVSTLESYARHFHNQNLYVKLDTEIITRNSTGKPDQLIKLRPDWT